MLDGGDCVLGVMGSISPPPNTVSRVDDKELDLRNACYLHSVETPVSLKSCCLIGDHILISHCTLISDSTSANTYLCVCALRPQHGGLGEVV